MRGRQIFGLFFSFSIFNILICLSTRLNHSPTCVDIFENIGFTSELIRCVQQIAKKSYCGGSYDLQCLCDSDHFVFSVTYVKSYPLCFQKLDPSEQYKFPLYFQSQCAKVTSTNKECIQFNSPPSSIPCLEPYKGVKWGASLYECLKNAASKSLCKQPYDANCLCDSQSHWAAVNKCLVTADLSKLAAIQELRKSLCHEPLTLPGCSGVPDVLPECSDVFENTNLDCIFAHLYEYLLIDLDQLKVCLREIAKNTYCGGSMDPVCLCDSKTFVDTTDNSNNYPQCFTKLSSEAYETYFNYITNLCKSPKSPSLCTIKKISPAEQFIFFDLYKDTNFDENLKKCLIAAAGNSLCKRPYKAMCLCDSRSYSTAVDKCIVNINDERKKQVHDFLKTLCENPGSLPGCSKESELMAICKDVYEKSSFSDDLKQCLRSIARSSRCGGSYDLTCLCDSNFYIESTLFVHTYAKCFRMFTVEEHLKYDNYHKHICEKPQPPPTQCVQLQVPTQKPVLCSNVYKDITFSGKLQECMLNSLKNTLCKEPYDALCLCDSKSYWDAVNKCIIITNNEEYKLIQDFHKTLCSNPTLLSGCDGSDIFASMNMDTPPLTETTPTILVLPSSDTLSESILTYTSISKTLIIPGIKVLDTAGTWQVKLGNTIYFVIGMTIIIIALGI
ncbi:hypothetical protein PCK1_002103 [Pneumocystis canis]|nr:hypothetical protein PCK1_002103 [Pneumocystis canis]